MTEDAIVLAGGLGTRLQSVVKDVPKPMAEVAGKPFLNYIMSYLHSNKIKKVVLAVGYKYEIIQQYLENTAHTYGLQVKYSIEQELLGTGGGIFQAFEMIEGDAAFVINGDTYFNVPLSDLEEFAVSKSADIALALKATSDVGRYGSVVCSPEDKVVNFTEKGAVQSGSVTINGGIYYMKKELTSSYSMPTKFSIEQDFFQANLHQLKAYGKVYDKAFIDIGIPDDYKLAQEMLRNEHV